MPDFDRPGNIFVTCARGVQDVLAREISALGAEPAQVLPSGVAVKGSLDLCMAFNLHLRTAHRVLFLLDSFTATNPDQLYRSVASLPFEYLLPVDGYFTVVSTTNTRAVKDSRFANLRVKDAVADRMAERMGRRPDSGPARTGAVLSLNWQDSRADLYLDTTGEPLSMRGYRTMPHTAPMRETLAAACLLACGYDGSGPVVNPMCGSGTLAIEAALMATATAPGLLRDDFAFQQIIDYDPDRWLAMRAKARSAMLPAPGHPIIATDHDEKAIQAARHNAEEAGMAQHIELSICDFQETDVPDPEPDGVNLIVVNPEYGQRMGQEDELRPVYSGLGDFFKKRCQGYRGAVFTGNPKLAKAVGLRTSRRVPLMNGPIDCRLLVYELYAGSKKAKAQGDESPRS